LVSTQQIGSYANTQSLVKRILLLGTAAGTYRGKREFQARSAVEQEARCRKSVTCSQMLSLSLAELPYELN